MRYDGTMNDDTNSQSETNRTVVEYTDENESRRAEMRTPDRSESEVTFTGLMDERSELQEQIIEDAKARGIPTDIIDLPPMMTPQYDGDGRMYVSDCNNVIRYYINVGDSGEGEVVPTDEFIQNAQTVESNERTNSFETIYNVA